MNKKILFAGVGAGLLMAMLEMVYEGIWGIGFWAAPVAIAALLMRGLQALTPPIPFLFVPAMLGMMIHLVNSVVLGLVFSLGIAPHFAGSARAAAAGALYGLAIFLFMWFIALPIVDPLMLALNAPVFLSAHLLWGGALGFFIARGRASA